MNRYSCSNNNGVRFTLSAPNASEALDRAVKQFHLNNQYHAPIIASSLTDLCDYKSTHELDGNDAELEVGVTAAVAALFE